MIFIDSREGSHSMAHLITDSILVTLDYGDAAFTGSGPDGDVSVGIERKRIGDLLNSIATGRLSGHQLPGLLAEYDKVYLIVEGVWRGNPQTGEIEGPRRHGWAGISHGRTFHYQDVWAYLTTLENTGVTVRTTRNMGETCRMIENLEHWWNKGWERHKSHLAMHKVTHPTALLRTSQPSLIRRIASELPLIGFDRSRVVEACFKSVRDMINADEKTWANVPGIGKVTAKSVVKAVKGEE